MKMNFDYTIINDFLKENLINHISLDVDNYMIEEKYGTFEKS